tara:strand:+ start:159 stop:1397 length:1239 start_codon:yes stop_codon:yes gene_type:complete
MAKHKKLNEQLDYITNFIIFFEFLKLGCTSFGGPIAHIGFFREHFVHKKKWIDDKSFLDIVSFSNFLPGPSSSQVGMCIGYLQKGSLGAFLAWLGFTLPSAIIMIVSAYGLLFYNNFFTEGLLSGIKACVIVIVFQAIFGMSKQYLNDYKKFLITIITTLILIFFTNNNYQLILIIISGIFGIFLFREKTKAKPISLSLDYISFLYLFIFVFLLLFFPILNQIFNSDIILISDKFFRVGSLVFGGGHVVLPLLQNEIVNFNLIDKDTFLFGYGLAQIIPGPLFTFSGFLGTSMDLSQHKVLIGIISLIMIFLPSFLLVFGAMPYWTILRNIPKVQGFLLGVNACVVGLLISAFYDPVITSSLNDAKSLVFLSISIIIIMLIKIPQWGSVIIVAGIGKLSDLDILNFSFDFLI